MSEAKEGDDEELVESYPRRLGATRDKLDLA